MEDKITKYFRHVDGLRGIAVLAVVLYHLEFKAFRGGFVGVDVFFVISGFLISRLIYSEYIKTGSFSFSRFYVRRCLRLFPALYFTLLLTLITSYFLLNVTDMTRFGGSLVYTLVPLSNFYFWMEAGYFDASAKLKPLLHMWSLSVEEQFYFVWPLALIVLLRAYSRRTAWIAIACVGILSLVAAEWLLKEHQATAFYLPFFRIFEFLIGAALVWIPKFETLNRSVRTGIGILGLGLMLGPVFMYSSETKFPGLHALIPCLGTALLIWGGDRGLLRLLLENRLVWGLGLISYSLYLIHWPLFIFYQYYKIAALTLMESNTLLVVSIIFSYGMYRYIETPFRSKRGMEIWSPSSVGAVALALSVLTIVPAAQAWVSGWYTRIDRVQNSDEEYTRSMHQETCSRGFGFCQRQDVDANYVIIGDSQSLRADYLLGVLAKKASQSISRGGFISSCFPFFQNGAPCEDEMNRKLETILKSKTQRVILMGFWMGMIKSYWPDNKGIEDLEFFSLLAKTLDRFSKQGKTAYVFGPMPYFSGGPQNCFNRPISSSCENMAPDHFEKQVFFNATMKRVVQEHGGRFFDIFSMICDEKSICKMGHSGRSFYEDEVHMDSLNLGSFLLMNSIKVSSIDHIFE